MTILAGVDGCPFGWLCITKDLNNGIIKSQIFSSATELFNQKPQPQLLAIDIPIGLPDAGSRKCDVLHWRLMNEKAVDLSPHQPTPAIMSPENLGRLLEDYYRLNGWDPVNGFPRQDTLKKLGLEFADSAIEDKREGATKTLPESCPQNK